MKYSVLILEVGIIVMTVLYSFNSYKNSRKHTEEMSSLLTNKGDFSLMSSKTKTTAFSMSGDCAGLNWNEQTNKSTLLVSATSNTSGNIAVLLDGNLSNNSFYYRDVSIAGAEVLRVTFPEADILTGLEYAIGDSYMFNTNATIKVQGSTDGTTWVDMTPLSEGTSPSLEISGNNYVKNRSLGNNHPGILSTAAHTERLFWTNTNSYTQYRVLGVSGNTNQNPWVNELFFQTLDGFELTNLACDDNATAENYTDDKLTFDFTALRGTGSYTVSIDGGFTITPTSGTFGTTISFTVSSGSSGAGNLNLTLTDATAACTTVVEISNTENACVPGPCGGPDWNDPAEKANLTGDFHIPGTGATAGLIGVLVDANNGSGVGSKNNSYTNEAVFIINFPQAAVLHGLEIISSGTPITGGEFRVEGSNDGTNYVAVSGDFTFGSNLNIGAAQYGTGTQAYTFPFANNTSSYTTYRLYATTMSTAFGSLFNNHSFTELYFDYDVFSSDMANVSFGDNGTPSVFDDDLVNFEMNPSPGTGTYSVQVLGGHTVSPTAGTYGQATSFQVSAGSAGTGDLTVLLIDQTVPCVQEIVLPNPDLTATVESSHAACASPTDDPLGTISLTAPDGVYTKADYNAGTTYAGSGFAAAIDVINSSTGFDLVSDLPNPSFTTYYTVRAYASETLYRDYVVSLETKACSVADLDLSVSPTTESGNEGELLTYAVTLTNAGPDPAINVEIKVDIPSGLELLTTTPSVGEFSPGTRLWTSDLVPVGDHQLSITYRMK